MYALCLCACASALSIQSYRLSLTGDVWESDLLLNLTAGTATIAVGLLFAAVMSYRRRVNELSVRALPILERIRRGEKVTQADIELALLELRRGFTDRDRGGEGMLDEDEHRLALLAYSYVGSPAILEELANDVLLSFGRRPDNPWPWGWKFFVSAVRRSRSDAEARSLALNWILRGPEPVDRRLTTSLAFWAHWTHGEKRGACDQLLNHIRTETHIGSGSAAEQGAVSD